MSDSENVAAVYADRISKAINDAADAGAPFGFVNEADETAQRIEEIPGYDAEEHDVDTLPDGWSVASPLDYLSDALDFRYIVDRERDYIGGEVCIALGGPNVWVTTGDRSVTVYWGGAPERRGLAAEFIDGLDEALSEMWEMGR